MQRSVQAVGNVTTPRNSNVSNHFEEISRNQNSNRGTIITSNRLLISVFNGTLLMQNTGETTATDNTNN